jgi:hypothetical protein
MGLPIPLEEPGEAGVGKHREMGLGSATDISLKRVRELAAEARALLAEGRDPLAARQASRRIPTFGEMADEVIASHESSWRNPKHRDQWRMILKTYAKPLRDLPVGAVTTEHVLDILRPLWSKVPETAQRLRGRIERVLDAAKAKGY